MDAGTGAIVGRGVGVCGIDVGARVLAAALVGVAAEGRVLLPPHAVTRAVTSRHASPSQSIRGVRLAERKVLFLVMNKVIEIA